MSGGFVVLHRSFMGWEWYDDINVKILFLHLILKANHRDKKWRGIDIKRGQTLTSLQSLSDETGLTVKQVRTSLNKLKTTGEVASKATNKYTLLTIENYSKYQDKDNQKARERASKQTNEGQSKGNQRATNNNDNKENNINNNASGYSILLNKNGMRVTPNHPELIYWEGQKIHVDELNTAIKKAHKANPDRITPKYLTAIIFNDRTNSKPKVKSDAEKVWDQLFNECICAPRLLTDVFGNRAELVKKAIVSGTGKQVADLKMNTPEFNQKVIKKQFINSYQSMESMK